MLDTAGSVTPARRTPWQIQRAVLFALLLRELKTRFGGRWLGAIWVLAEPLAHLLLMMLIYSGIRGRVVPGVEFPVFLVTGLVPFFMFRNVALRLMEAVDGNRGLFAYRQVKPMDALLSRAMLEVSLYSMVYVMLLALMAWAGMDAMPHRPLEVIGISATLLALAFAVGLLLAVLTNEVPEARSLVRIAFFPLYLISGVLFPVAAMPPQALSWLTWNPVLHAIELLRAAHLAAYRPIPDASASYVATTALVLLALALSVYRVRRQRLLAI